MSFQLSNIEFQQFKNSFINRSLPDGLLFVYKTTVDCSQTSHSLAHLVTRSGHCHYSLRERQHSFQLSNIEFQQFKNSFINRSLPDRLLFVYKTTVDCSQTSHSISRLILSYFMIASFFVKVYFFSALILFGATEMAVDL